MKTIKSVIIGALVALLGSSVLAENMDFEVDVQLGVGGTTNALEVLNAALIDAGRAPVAIDDVSDWVVWPAPNTDNAKVASMAWDGESLAIEGVANGTAETVLRYKGGVAQLDVEYTFNVCVSTVDIEKTVVSTPAIAGDENDHSNATIRIVSHVDCGTADQTSTVLYIGSLCGKHSLKQDTVQQAIEAVVKKANVDWYFFDNAKSDYNVVACKKDYFGSFAKGDTVEGLPLVGNDDDTKHCNLRAYMNLITNKLDIVSMSYKKYDYIILEFDSDRMLEYYDSDPGLEDCVARCLKKYYEKHLVLWLVDNDPSDNPWGFKDSGTPWWTPTTYTKVGAAAVDGKWNGYVALFDPHTYYEKSRGQRYVSSETKSGVLYYKANRIEEQVQYDDPTAVVNAIDKYVVLSTFNATVQDTVVRADDTMNIAFDKGVKFYMWAGASEPTKGSKAYYADLPNDSTHWNETAGKEIAISPSDYHSVNVAVSNILGSTWTKIEIPVRTEAGFMDKVKADAEGEQKFAKKSDDGKSYQINPNDGDAKLTLYRSAGSSSAAVCAAGAAAIAETWDIPAEEKEFLVCSSNAVRVYDGIATNVYIAVTNEELTLGADYDVHYRNKGSTRWNDYDWSDPEGWPYILVSDSTNVEFWIESHNSAYKDLYATNDYDYLTVTITPAKIRPQYPQKDKSPEQQQPPENPDPENPDNQTAPSKSAGPTLWAPDVVKVYDGIPTNTKAQVYNYQDGNTFGYLYTTNADTMGWVPYDELKLVNVLYDNDGEVTSYQVYYCATNDERNYIGTNCFSWVTILPLPLTNTETRVVAGDGSMTYGKFDTRTAVESLDWDGPHGLVGGDALKTVKLAYTNDTKTVLEALPVNEEGYAGFVSTNVADWIVITNAANEEVTKNYIIGFEPGKLKVTAAKAEVVSGDATREYDGVATNVVITSVNGSTDLSGCTINFRTVGTSGWLDWKDSANWPYVNAMEETKVEFWVKVANYAEYFGTNTVTITKRPVTLTSGDKPDFVYDGNPHAYTNLTISGKGFASGEGLKETNDWAEVTNVKDSPKDNAFTYQLQDNTLAGNYIFTVNTGKLTVVAAKLKEKKPENDKKEENPDEEPEPDEGPTIWAQNIFKEWDGVPTNIVAKVYNVLPSDEAMFTYQYTTNKDEEASWKPSLSFTDPVLAQKVYYRAVPASGANYIGTNCYAYVTIWKRAEEKQGDVPMDESDLAQLNEDLKKITDENDPKVHPFIKVQLTVDETNKLDNANTWIGPADAKTQAEAIVAASPAAVVDSHFYDIVLERTYEVAIANNEQHIARNYNNSNRWENAGWDDIGDGTDKLLTVALTPFTEAQMAGKSLIGVFRHHNGAVDMIPTTPAGPGGEYYEVDGLKIILHVKKFSIYGFLLKSNAAVLKASLDWAYNNGTGQYVAQLKVACTNGIENLDAEDVKFAFEDRVDEDQQPYATLKQWASGCRFAEDAQEETISGKKYRVCVIDAGAARLKAAGLDQEIVVGPASIAGTVVQMADRAPGLPCLFVADRLKPIYGNEASAKSTVKSFLGYVLWKANGTQWALPVTAGAAAQAAVDWPTQPLVTLFSVAQFNNCLSLGMPPSASKDLSCAITEFAVSDGRIAGRIGTSDGLREGVPAAAATVVLRGAKDLGVTFDRLGELDCDAEGRFEAEAPTGYRYFQVDIESGEIVK